MSGRAKVREHGHSHLVIILLSVIVGIGLAALWYHPKTTSAQPQAPPPRLQGIEDEFVAIAERAKRAVVKINVHTFTDRRAPTGLEERWREFFGPSPFFPEPRRDEDGPRRPIEQTSEGSGFFFKEGGYILTNNHVVAGAKKIEVEVIDEREFDAKLIGTDKKTELAVLKIDGAGDHEYLTLADSDTARVGSWAIAIGMPFREAWSVTVGIVSAKGRAIPGETDYLQLTDLIQTDAAINPGNSGGPLLNIRGEVIGINVAIRTEGAPRSAGVGYAVPSNTAKAIAPQLLETGHVARGYLGIEYSPLKPEDIEVLKDIHHVDVDHGMWISRVEPDSPAGKAGFQVGDVLTRFGDRELENTEDLQHIVSVTPPGTTVEATVLREGQPKTLKITLGEVPAEFVGDTQVRPATAVEDKDETETALGITVEDMDRDTAEELGLKGAGGAIVTEIDPDSPAIGTMLSPGDVIVEVHGSPVKDASDFKSALEKLKDKPVVGLTIVNKRGNDARRMLVTIRPH